MATSPFQDSETGPRPAPAGQRLILIAWLFMALVGATLCFAYYSMGVLSATRAFVAGEGQWSKAQREAIYALSRYVDSHNDHDYMDYRTALSVILGDRQFRLELDSEAPDLGVSRQGLLQGRNHPDDVDGMISLFRTFRHLTEIEQAVQVWAEADRYIDTLRALGDRLHGAVQSGGLDEITSAQVQNELRSLNTLLAPLEDRFSSVLGQAARRAKSLLLWSMFIAATLLAAAALLFSRRLIRDSDRLQQVLRDGEKQMAQLLQLAPFPIVITEEGTGAIVYVNRRAEIQFKMSSEKMCRAKASDFYCRVEERAAVLQRYAGRDSLSDMEVEMKDAGGVRFWAVLSSQRIQFRGRPCNLNAVNNIDQRKRAEDALHHRAFHDELTGLPNRAMCMDALGRILAKSQRKGLVFSILFIDLDHFKSVNDSLGHDAGDQLLLQVAQRALGCVRSSDLVARLGGDEFIVCIEEHSSQDELRDIADKILHALEPPYMLDGHSVRVTASIGISSYPQDGADLQQLMSHADNAMYHAKDDGRNVISFFTPL